MHKKSCEVVKYFHPEGKRKPNGSHYQRGGFFYECKKNADSFVIDENVFVYRPDTSDHIGGIIVLPTNTMVEYNSVIHSFIDKFQVQNRESFGNYSVGYSFFGKFKGDSGDLYSDKSLAVAISGLSSEMLLDVAEYIMCKMLQTAVLIKDLNKNIILRMKSEADMPKLSEVYRSINDTSLYSLNNDDAQFLVDRHTTNGYAIISADMKIKSLLSEVRTAGFSYTLLYGSFIENNGTERMKIIYERSIIVYASKESEGQNMESLFDFAIRMCGMFSQKLVLICFPGKVPAYYNAEGTVDSESGSNLTLNGIVQEYFTTLHKLTFIESYIAPIPQCYSENHLRYLRGEIFVKR